MQTIDARVRAEQVRVIYRQAIPAQAISVFVAATLGVVLWDVSDRRLLTAWLVLVAVVALVRVVLVQRFRSQTSSDLSRWERLFVISFAATSLVWGVGGWLIMPAASPLHQAVVYFFLMGMAGGAVASYAAHSASAVLGIGGVMIPATVWLALQDGIIPKAMAVGGLIYVAAASRATRTLAFFLRRSFQLAYELQESQEAAEQRARTDDLTGLRNRRAFSELGELALAQAARYRRPLSLVMLDIDRFKAINDRLGHAAGDRAIVAVAGAIRQTARATDVIARIGGDEFVILLPETGGDAAIPQAERVRQAVSALRIGPEDRELTVTCSFGVVEWEAGMASLDALLNGADAALYEAKAQGRNRVSRRVAV